MLPRAQNVIAASTFKIMLALPAAPIARLVPISIPARSAILDTEFKTVFAKLSALPIAYSALVQMFAKFVIMVST